jgi:DNA-binding transcriptional LysR family regulator
MSVELRQLRYFVAVAEDRHFGRAAARLQIAQPGLSQQIKRLERLIGVQLFVRDKRHVDLTPAGEVLLEHARIAIEMTDRAVANTRAVGQGKTDMLKVGAYARGVFPVANELLTKFEERFPHVAVEFHPGHSRTTIEALTRRAIDVGVVFAPFEPVPGMAYATLGSVEAVLGVPSGHRLASLDRIPRSELLKETILMWPRELNAPLVDGIRAAFFGEVRHEDIVEIADVTEILARAAAGEGIAITNPMAGGLDITNIVVCRLERPEPVFDYGFVWLEPTAVHLVDDFMGFARELTAAAV